MPRLACFICGRSVWATVALAQLFAEERRCPRCGASLHDDRRAQDRRYYVRRKDHADLLSSELDRRKKLERRARQRRRII